MYLGQHAISNGLYGPAIEWFQTALDRSEDGDTTANKDEILLNLRSATDQVRKIKSDHELFE